MEEEGCDAGEILGATKRGPRMECCLHGPILQASGRDKAARPPPSVRSMTTPLQWLQAGGQPTFRDPHRGQEASIHKFHLSRSRTQQGLI